MKLVLPTTLLTALALIALAGCSKKSDNKPAATAPAGDQPAAEGSAAPPAAAPAAPANPAPSADTSADLPSECTDYAALVDKLKTCDKLGAARAALTQAYENLRTAWGTTPPERRGEITAQCKTQAESLRNAAAATCGW
jgi:uncharacterized membrane protein YdfJ with MMPL/SSD domain